MAWMFIPARIFALCAIVHDRSCLRLPRRVTLQSLTVGHVWDCGSGDADDDDDDQEGGGGAGAAERQAAAAADAAAVEAGAQPVTNPSPHTHTHLLITTAKSAACVATVQLLYTDLDASFCVPPGWLRDPPSPSSFIIVVFDTTG